MQRRVVYGLVAIGAAAISFTAAAARPDGSEEHPAVDGAALFGLKGCATCHDGPDSTSFVDAGPSLAAASSWAGDRIEGASAHEYLKQSMRNPSAFISPAYRPNGGPTDDMPLLQLSDDEIDTLVGYLLDR
jgi:hypothetical protein